MKNIRNLVLEDDGFMGEVARSLDNGLTYDKIAENSGHKTTMQTFIFLKAIKCLTGKMRYDEIKRESQKHAYYKARKWQNLPFLNKEERSHMKTIVSYWEDENEKKPSSPSPEERRRDFSKSSGFLSQPENEKLYTRSGVYVYTYSLYLDVPVSPQDNRTLFKVGASSVNARERIDSQASNTPVPDDIKIVRVFECSDAIKEEKKFHRILMATGHGHDTNNGGTEWFLTKLSLIDAIAESLGLFNVVNSNTNESQ